MNRTRATYGRAARGTVSMSLAIAFCLPWAAPEAGDEPRWLGTAVLYPRSSGIQLPGREPVLVLEPTFVHLAGSRWNQARIAEAAETAAAVLAQCDVAISRIALHRVEVPGRYQDFHVPASRELARRLGYPKPTIYFVRDTRQRTAFDAEAIGRANSRGRPELQDTVWITEGIRDPGIALAHELAHVLMDSGEHVELAGNLMRDETAPENRELTPAQCARLRATGEAHGLLQAAGSRAPARRAR
jgi:hypothetical protein